MACRGAPTLYPAIQATRASVPTHTRALTTTMAAQVTGRMPAQGRGRR